MPITWDISLVVLSVVIAIVGSFTALTHAQRMHENTGRTATLWMVAGGSTLGVAVWSMHFVGMLAFQLPIPIGYDPALTLISLIPAVLAALLGFWVLHQSAVTLKRILLSGLVMGLGISAMHYIGMAALKMMPAISYEPGLFVLSVLLSVFASWGALIIMYHEEWFELPSVPRFALGAVLMGFAISSMHYTAMWGMYIPEGSLCRVSALNIDPSLLAAMIALTASLWFGGGIMASLFDQRMARQNACALAELESAHEALKFKAEQQADEMLQHLRDSEERLRMTLKYAPDAVFITEQDGRIIYVNDNVVSMLDYAREELYLGMTVFDLVPADWRERYRAGAKQIVSSNDRYSFEVRLLKKDGSKIPMELNAVLLPNGRVYGSCRDITERKRNEQQIHQLAFFDSLTGLPNRRLLMDRVGQAMAISARSERYSALMLLDLDNFKQLNDSKGHNAGDLLLQEVAKRLQACVREGDSVARLGGDEFVVMLETLSGISDVAAEQAELVAEKIRAALSEPCLLENLRYQTSSSIGVTLFRGHQEAVDVLFKHADIAMYQAKQAGRDAIRFFDPKMQAAIDARMELEAELEKALHEGQLCLYYQIQVDTLGRALGAEVLMRWQHPARGLVSPAQFIPLAEETGLIVPMGLWALRTACWQLNTWQHDLMASDLSLAVNVSAKQFRKPDFVQQVSRILLETGAKPSHLKLELTESTVLEDVEDTIHKMRELKLLGISFSMDDFGTGYSSLQYLKRLPLDQIKIDQSFVRDIATDPNDAAIVQTIIAMTEALGLNVIAEGVETKEQQEFLDLRGCHAFQGYFFGKPVPLDQFMLRLKGEA